MVQTQFYEKKNVKVFKSDNSKEYFNKVWGIFSQKMVLFIQVLVTIPLNKTE